MTDSFYLDGVATRARPGIHVRSLIRQQQTGETMEKDSFDFNTQESSQDQNKEKQERKTIRAGSEDLKAFEKLTEELGGQREAFRVLLQCFASSNPESSFKKETADYDALFSRARDINRGIIATAEIKISQAEERLAKQEEIFQKRIQLLEERNQALRAEVSGLKAGEKEAVRLRDEARKMASEAERRAESAMAALEREQQKNSEIQKELELQRAGEQELRDRVALSDELKLRVSEQSETMNMLRASLNAGDGEKERLNSELALMEEKLKAGEQAQSEKLQELSSEWAEKLDQAVRLAKAETRSEYESKLRILQEKMTALYQGSYPREGAGGSADSLS